MKYEIKSIVWVKRFDTGAIASYVANSPIYKCEVYRYRGKWAYLLWLRKNKGEANISSLNMGNGSIYHSAMDVVNLGGSC